MPPKNKYTNPKLRDEVKEDIQKSDKGGAPGQWSARKAQFMASEYKKRGGDYNTDKKDQDEAQKNLSKWGEEEWQTKEGSGNAKQEDGTRKRYLPRKAWKKMDEREKQETEDTKLNGSKKGKQFVGNTEKAKGARKAYLRDPLHLQAQTASSSMATTEVNEEENEEYEAKKEEEKARPNSYNSNAAEKDSGEEDGEAEGEEEEPKRGRKRKSARTTSGANKKARNSKTEDTQKSAKEDKKFPKPNSERLRSKHDSSDTPGQQASIQRLRTERQKKS